ncbi:MAG: RNA-directed DNA polymerase [Patescibacteria group bacterium]
MHETDRQYRQRLIDAIERQSDLEDMLLIRGYFPEPTIIPPFVAPLREGISGDGITREPITLFAPKGANGWRDFSLLHPNNYLKVVKTICNLLPTMVSIWQAPQRIISFSIPQAFDRQIERPEQQIIQWVEMQSRIFANAQELNYSCIFQADIQQCYHVMYTHVIEWVLESSGARNPQELDIAVRRGNRNRTHGLPVGPAATDYVAETVLCHIDCEIEKDLEERGIVDYCAFRFKDNYYFLSASPDDLDEIQRLISLRLRYWHLTLNEKKSKRELVSVYLSDRWQNKYESVVSILDKHASSVVPLPTLQAFIGNLLALSASYDHEKAIIQKALKRLVGIRPTKHSDYRQYFLLIASLIEARNALPGILAVLRILYQEDTSQLKDTYNRFLTTQIKSAHSKKEINSLLWLSYITADNDEGEMIKLICGALNDYMEDPLAKTARDYIQYVQSGEVPRDSILWDSPASLRFIFQSHKPPRKLYDDISKVFAES